MREPSRDTRGTVTHKQHSNKLNQKRYHTALIQFLQCHCKAVFQAQPPPLPPSFLPSPSPPPLLKYSICTPLSPAAFGRTTTSLDPKAPLLQPSISAASLSLSLRSDVFSLLSFSLSLPPSPSEVFLRLPLPSPLYLRFDPHASGVAL